MLGDLRLWTVYDLDEKRVLASSLSQSLARNSLYRSRECSPCGRFVLLRFDLCQLYKNADEVSPSPCFSAFFKGKTTNKGKQKNAHP